MYNPLSTLKGCVVGKGVKSPPFETPSKISFSRRSVSMNTVSIRIKGNSTSKSINQLAHDMRIKSVNYLKNENQDNLLVADEEILFSQNEKNQEKFNQLKKKMLKSAEEQRQNHESTIGQKSQIKNYFIDGIITFSEDMREDFFNDQKLFRRLAKETLQEMGDKYNILLMHHTIHLDEKTPHIHFCFENINRETGRSVQRYITKLDLKQLQTDVGAKWEEMGYKRGKEDSKAKHYSVAIGHQKEKLEELRDTLDNVIDEIKKNKKIIKASEKDIQTKKEELDKLDALLKEARVEAKVVKKMDIVDHEIEENIDEIIKKSKSIFKLDEDKLRANMREKMKELAKTNFKSLEEQNALSQANVLLNENYELREELKDIKKVNNELSNENLELENEIDELNDENDYLQRENEELKENIQELEKIYKFNYKEFKENRKSRYQEMKEKKQTYHNR